MNFYSSVICTMNRKPLNNNIFLSLVEEFQTESGISYHRDTEYDNMLNTEVCCKVEVVGESDHAKRIKEFLDNNGWVWYFLAMKGELKEIENNLFYLHEERVRYLTKEPIYLNTFSNNLRKLHDI